MQSRDGGHESGRRWRCRAGLRRPMSTTRADGALAGTAEGRAPPLACFQRPGEHIAAAALPQLGFGHLVFLLTGEDQSRFMRRTQSRSFKPSRVRRLMRDWVSSSSRTSRRQQRLGRHSTCASANRWHKNARRAISTAAAGSHRLVVRPAAMGPAFSPGSSAPSNRRPRQEGERRGQRGVNHAVAAARTRFSCSRAICRL